jgi:3',5'-cyclic AMP phosphodiesterase CpdA
VNEVNRRDSKPMTQSLPLFSFAVIADTHLNPERTKNTSPWRTNRLANKRTEFIVNELNRINPAFVVHLGDIIHPVPKSPDYVAAADLSKELFQRLRPPFYLLAGNHDVGDKPLDWMPADCITHESRLLFRRTFGADWGAFEYDNCHFIRINSSLLNSKLDAEDEQRKWLEAELSAAARRRIFLFSHYPPYVSRADEESHYDNLDQPARAWLCDLLVRHRVEALFAGHVHNFFYNRYGTTDCYILPSPTNLRQDYAELFRIEPADEYGRNDTPKLGFFLVDVYRDKHVIRFVRTNGETGDEPSSQITCNSVRPLPSPVGVHLRHSWAEEVALPYNAPLDELGRKRVRNDYGLLAMWDLGIAKLRVPLSDLANDLVRKRMWDLHQHGQRFTVFSFGVPDTAVLQLMIKHRSLVERWEVVISFQKLDLLFSQLRTTATTALSPVTVSKLRGHSGAVHDSTIPFDHSINLGFTAYDSNDIDFLRTYSQKQRSLRGVTFTIDIDQPIASNVARIADVSRNLNLEPLICVKLAPARSASDPPTDHIIANRVAEAVLCAWCDPSVEIFLDTFEEIDRGYFLRPGLVDRRCNPRVAGRVFRNFQLALQNLKPNAPLQESMQEGTRTLSFRASEAEGILWVPDTEQQTAKIIGDAVPLVPTSDGLNSRVIGPWIQIRYRSELTKSAWSAKGFVG